MGQRHKSHRSHATRTFSDTNQTNTKTSCTAPESKGVSPTQITAPSLSSHNLHAKPSHLRSSLNQRSPPCFFLHFYASGFVVDTHTLAISFLPSSHFRWPKVMSVVPIVHQILAIGCQVFGPSATSLSLKDSALFSVRSRAAASSRSALEGRTHRSHLTSHSNERGKGERAFTLRVFVCLSFSQRW